MATVRNETCLRELGRGAFAKVYLVKTEVHAGVIACKQIQISDLNQEKRAKVMKEVNILRALQHPHIVRLYESFEVGNLLHVHMEYVDGIDLGRLLKHHKTKDERFTEDKVMCWFAQLCFAVEYVHSQNIIHRDIKPTNCFLEVDQDIVKLGDFGLSQNIPWYSPRSNGFVGTPYYMSPEVLNGLDYTSKADVWSLAILLYEMLTLHRPFLADNLEELKVKVQRRDFKPLTSKDAPEDVRSLFLEMLQSEESHRLSSAEVISSPCVASAFRKLHPFHRASQRSTSSWPFRWFGRGRYTDCHVAVLESKKVPDISDLLASRADSISLTFSSNSISHRRTNPVDIDDRTWRRARLTERGSHFVIKRGWKTIFKFPSPGDRLFRASSEGHPYCVIIARAASTYVLSLPDQNLLDPLLQHLDSEPTVRAGVPTQVDTFVKVYNKSDRSWARVYMVTWRSHIFLGAHHLQLHETEVLPPSSASFTRWLPSLPEGCRLVLRTADKGAFYIIADTPYDTRKIVAALQTAGCISVWRIMVSNPSKRRSLSSSHTSVANKNAVSAYKSPGLRPFYSAGGLLPIIETDYEEADDEPPRSQGRPSEKIRAWAGRSRSSRIPDAKVNISILSPPLMEKSLDECAIYSYQISCTLAQFRDLVRACTAKFPDAPTLSRRIGSQTARTEQIKPYMEAVMLREDCREFWLSCPETELISKQLVFEDEQIGRTKLRRRRSVKWSESDGAVSDV